MDCDIEVQHSNATLECDIGVQNWSAKLQCNILSDLKDTIDQNAKTTPYLNASLSKEFPSIVVLKLVFLKA